MSDRRRCQPLAARGRTTSSLSFRPREGQALAEYVLILALVAIALIAVLTITGPAVGDVFSNAVYNLLGGTVVPRATLQADDFWEQVAAVASYTPENPLSITNTPVTGPEVTEPSNPPEGTEPSIPPEGTEPSEPPETEEPVETETPEPTEEPEPPDQEFPYPFEDPGNNPNWWDTDSTNLLGEWYAEFWDYHSPTASDMTGMQPGFGKWRTTYGSLDHTWPSGTSPGGSVHHDFYARFTTTATLENEEYILRVRKDDGMRVWIGGVLVFDEWNWTNSDWKAIPFTPAAGTHEVVVELFDSGGAGVASVFITQEGESVNCNWTLTDEAFYSAPTSWTDSAGGNYAPYSYCVLRLRGTIDLTGAEEPKLEFHDRYSIGTGAGAKIGIAVAGSDTWTEVDAHSTGTNLSWTRQVYDLANFGGQDFRDQVIELRFVLDNPTGNTGDGWWIDDIAVEEQPLKVYTVGFSDDMEGPSYWFAGGAWARTNEWPHSPEHAWSDSPNGSYSLNTDSVLELDGKIVLDNEQLEGDPVVQPEMVFWHRYDLRSGASVYAEISTDERQSWTRLTGTHLAAGTTNKAYSQVVIPLDAYIGQSFHFRFRMNVTGSASPADGWYIDDFALRNRYDGLIHLNWCDNVEDGGGSWLPMGSWAVVDGVDDNPGQNPPITAHSGSKFFSDSPQKNYEHGTNSVLQLLPRLNLTSATHPELTFWHQWDIEADEKLYVEVSDDLGQTWTTLWTKVKGVIPSGYHSSTRISSSYYFDSILSWTREVVDLSDYVGTELMLRFRFDATSNPNVDDGWWIDDICVQERVDVVYSLPFTETFESGGDRWHWGGSWARTSGGAYSGSYLAQDSPGGDYQHESNGILELRGAIDLRTAVQPTLYIWDRFSLNDYDSVYVEARSSNGEYQSWSSWQRLDVVTDDLSTVWTRRQPGSRASLEGYAGKLVQLRFRVYAERDWKVSDGWYIDDITVIDRNGAEPVFTLPFKDDAEIEHDYWVFDGTWSRVQAIRPIGSGAILGPGGWTAEYFEDVNQNRAFDSGELRATQIEGEINHNWGSDGPSVAGMEDIVDDFLVRWTRDIYVPEDGTIYQIQTRSDDGIRVFVDGKTVINKWSDRGYSSTPDIGTTDPLSAGWHTVVVEYYERSGNARVDVNFAQQSYVYDDSPGANYVHGSNASMTLEGVIEIPEGSTSYLTFWNQRRRESGDTFLVEVSTDGGYSWNSIKSWTNTVTWQKESLSLSSYKGQSINIRFRLDARSNTRVHEGWIIDDIQVYQG